MKDQSESKVTDNTETDKFRDECGIFAVWNNEEAANLTYLGLYAQQHRGQEGAGVVSCCTDGLFRAHRSLGLVNEVFENFDFAKLSGRSALGHVRYTTAGGNLLANVQPFEAEIGIGSVAVAHNGNLINVEKLKRELVESGSIFRTTSDTELFLHLVARAEPQGSQADYDPCLQAVIAALRRVRGAYSLGVMFRDRLLAIRDPKGLRPLSLGKLEQGWVIASETCAFDLVGASFVREILPGEILEIKNDCEPRSYFPLEKAEPTPCVFEFIYFARPDSDVFGKNVYQVRKALGAELARQSAVAADFVVPVLDSGMPAALGYSQQSGIPLELGLIRNHYIGRTFIEPKQSIRDFGVKIKLNANPAVLKDKSVVVVDDSIVRGTTSRKLVKMIRNAGAREVHLRISSPPTISPCYYGIDTPERKSLIAASMTADEIARYLEVDSLCYLSREGIYAAIAGVNGGRTAKELSAVFCDACFSGNYPLGTPGDYI